VRQAICQPVVVEFFGTNTGGGLRPSDQVCLAGGLLGVRRRNFITLLGGAAAWRLAAWAQQRAVPVIGILSAQSAELDYKDVTVRCLKETGYVEGQNVAMEYRYAENQYDRLPALAADPRSGDRSRHRRSARGEGSDHDHTDRLCRR
jgi:hypothetical protein